MMVHPVQRCFRTVGQLSLLCFDSRQVPFRRCLRLLLVRLAEEQEPSLSLNETLFDIDTYKLPLFEQSERGVMPVCHRS